MIHFEHVEAQLAGKTPVFIYRAKVPGGWLIFVVYNTGVAGQGGPTFLPDPNHTWDGSSLP